MRVLLTLAVVAAFLGCAIGAYAVYVWQWADSEEAKAEAYAESYAHQLGVRVNAVERVARDVWRVRTSGGCALVNLAFLVPTEGAFGFPVISRTRC